MLRRLFSHPESVSGAEDFRLDVRSELCVGQLSRLGHEHLGNVSHGIRQPKLFPFEFLLLAHVLVDGQTVSLEVAPPRTAPDLQQDGTGGLTECQKLRFPRSLSDISPCSYFIVP